MITSTLKNPKIGDTYFWKEENIRICVSEILGSVHNGIHTTDSVNYFKNGEYYSIEFKLFPYLILSMSENYEFENVLEE